MPEADRERILEMSKMGGLTAFELGDPTMLAPLANHTPWANP